MDTVYSVLIIFNLDNRLKSVRQELEKDLSSEFLEKLLSTIQTISSNTPENIITEYYISQNEEGLPTLNLYRASAAFLEHPKYAKYRNEIDRVIGVRLLSEIANTDTSTISTPLDDKSHY